jgi:hypothetical protein
MSVAPEYDFFDNEIGNKNAPVKHERVRDKHGVREKSTVDFRGASTLACFGAFEVGIPLDCQSFNGTVRGRAVRVRQSSAGSRQILPRAEGGTKNEWTTKTVSYGYV